LNVCRESVSIENGLLFTGAIFCEVDGTADLSQADHTTIAIRKKDNFFIVNLVIAKFDKKTETRRRV
jgi:hypothetical protein